VLKVPTYLLMKYCIDLR